MDYRFILRSLGTSLICVALSACSEKSEGPTENADAAGGNAGVSSTDCPNARENLCTAASARLVRCDEYTEEQRAANYNKCTTRTATVPFNCKFVTSYVDCVTSLDCDIDEEKCIFQGMIAAKPSGWDTPTIEACLDGTMTDAATCKAAFGGTTAKCLAKYEACGGSEGSPFADDACYTIGALTNAGVASTLDCLSLDCAAAGDCLRNAGTFSY